VKEPEPRENLHHTRGTNERLRVRALNIGSGENQNANLARVGPTFHELVDSQLRSHADHEIGPVAREDRGRVIRQRRSAARSSGSSWRCRTAGSRCRGDGATAASANWGIETSNLIRKYRDFPTASNTLVNDLESRIGKSVDCYNFDQKNTIRKKPK
jgi:hypothetical protein